MQAMPAAPAPLQTSLVVFMSRPVISSALMRPAAAMIAVPCWSSWKTGMSISSRSRCSMMKQSGALMSSRLMPPKEGPRIAHAVDELVGVLGVDLEVDGIDVGEALEQHRLAFHHRLRGQRAEIAEAEDGGAVGDDGDHVAARRVVEGAARIFGDGLDRHGDARRIGERQVALRRHRLGRVDLQLAGPAHGVEFQRLLRADGRAGICRFSCLTP